MKPIACILLLASLTAAQADDPAPMPECALEVCAEKPGPKTEAIPKQHADEKKVAIKLEHLKREANGRYIATFRLINPGKQKLSYYMYPMGQPKADTQVQKQGKWVYPEWHALVSAAFRQFTVESGQSVVFVEELNGADLPARIGIGCWNPDAKVHRQETIWSEPVER